MGKKSVFIPELSKERAGFNPSWIWIWGKSLREVSYVPCQHLAFQSFLNLDMGKKKKILSLNTLKHKSFNPSWIWIWGKRHWRWFCYFRWLEFQSFLNLDMGKKKYNNVNEALQDLFQSFLNLDMGKKLQVLNHRICSHCRFNPSWIWIWGKRNIIMLTKHYKICFNPSWIWIWGKRESTVSHYQSYMSFNPSWIWIWGKRLIICISIFWTLILFQSFLNLDMGKKRQRCPRHF